MLATVASTATITASVTDTDAQKQGGWEFANHRGGDAPAFTRGSYDYAPTVMKDGRYRMWWCAGVAGDFIQYAEADSLSGPWYAPGSSTPNSSASVFGPSHGTPNFDNVHTCDPSVIRVNGVYYMYYGGLKQQTATAAEHMLNGTSEQQTGGSVEGALEPTAIGVAQSADGINWTRLNGGAPIIGPARDVNTVANPYGAGQPSVTHVDGLFYMTYTDTTGHASQANGNSQYVLRSPDPTFQTDVEELTAGGFAPRTAENHTRFAFIHTVTVDWQYSDLLGGFIIGIDQSEGQMEFQVWDASLSHQLVPGFSVAGLHREGPGLVSRPDKHAMPSAECGVVPIDVMRAVGSPPPDYESWELGHRGFDIRTGLSCEQSNLAATVEGVHLHTPSRPLAGVFWGQRLNFELGLPALHLSRNALAVSDEFFDRIPHGGSLLSGQRAIMAPGRPGAFLIEGRLWPISCSEVLSANGSTITSVPVEQYDSYPIAAILHCVK